MATATQKRQRRKSRPLDAIAARARALGSLYKFSDSDSVALDIDTQPAIDVGTMSVLATISTPAPDRVRDVLIPAGCQLDNYRKNPVVLWEHGFEGLPPIAKSEGPDGLLTVGISDAEVFARAYFTNKVRESEQIFALIEAGIVRATSVRACPIKSRRLQSDDSDQLFVMDEWDLEEWSFVGVGMNPEAVRKTIDANSLAGSAIAEPILKSLTPHAARRSAQGIGWKPKENPVAKTLAKSKVKAGDPPPEEAEEELDDEGNPVVKESDDPPPESTTTPPEEVEEDAPQPLGAQALMAIHADLSATMSKVSEAIGLLENPDVKTFLEQFVTDTESKLAEFEGMFSSQGYEGEIATTPDESEVESLKSWLRNGAGPRLQLQGLGQRLKSLASARNLQPEQRRVVSGVVKHLARIVSESRSGGTSRDSSSVEASLLAACKDLSAVAMKLKESVPQN